jgi:hypothetical protein
MRVIGRIGEIYCIDCYEIERNETLYMYGWIKHDFLKNSPSTIY